ncbi:MAG: MFS transporter [Gammaproteobacteria bacterium]|nr:MFS transporter [Gammaproteobacteria bacterium]
MSKPKVEPFRQIVWPLAIAETIVWAAMFYSFPALILVWERDLGWSKTELSGAFTLSLVAAAVLAPVVGRLIDHGFGRFVLTGCTLAGAVLLVLLSTVTELWQFYVIWLGLGIAMSGTLYEACFAVLTRTMGPRAKRAITLVTLIAGFAGTVSFPSAYVLVGFVGWRGAVVVFAVVVAFIAAPLIWWGVSLAEQSSESKMHPVSRGTGEALRVLRSATFWLLAISFAMIALEHGILLTHLLPLLDERGIQAETAILAASMIGPMQVAGRLAMIAAERHVTILTIAAASYVAMGIAALSLLGAGAIPVLLVAFVLFQGSGYGVTSIVRPVVTAEFLGRKNFGVISGLLALPFIAATAAAPTIAAFVWETGGYDRVIMLAIFAAGVGLVSILLAASLTARKATA